MRCFTIPSPVISIYDLQTSNFNRLIYTWDKIIKFELYVYEIYSDDAPEDEEDTVDRKRLKIRSESAHRKVEEDEPRKSKKKARVLVEVSDQRFPLFF